MSEASDLRRNPVVDRDGYERRLALAKRIAEKAAQAALGSLIPADMKALLGDLAVFLVELAQLSHAKFEMYPFDLGALTRRVDALDGLTGEGGLPALEKRVADLERKHNG